MHRPPSLPPLRRSVLFFPADRPERYEKAVASGADSVCCDLEDAVMPDAKDQARQKAVTLLANRAPSSTELILRVNTPKSPAGLRDLLALLEGGAPADAVMIPKITSPAEVSWVDGLLGPAFPHLQLIPMIETAAALAAAAEIVRASPRVSGVLMGGVDLSTELGSTREWESLLYARSRMVHAAAQAAIAIVDMPYLDVADVDGLARETAAVRRLGFTGRTAIHPSQVPVIHRAFAPTDDELRRAREMIAAYDRQRGGVLLLDGKLVERPVILAAQRTLAIADAIAARGDGSGSGNR